MTNLKKHILIVDDDRELCYMLQRYLTIKGFNVTTAYSGEDALSLVSHTRFDLVILDVMMPGIDGYEVCQRIKIQRELNRIPILMLSAKSTDQDRIEGLKTGADAYICKPFESLELFKAINDTIEKNHNAFIIDGVQYEISFQFESRFAYLEKVNNLIAQLFARTELAPDEIWELKLALHELSINAIEHGNKLNPRKSVTIWCCLYADRLELEIQDEGDGFNMGAIPDPTDAAGLWRDRGRGIFLVSQLVDDIQYLDGGSRVRLTRSLTGERKRAKCPPA